jgi:hypothetical protein
MPQRLVQRRMRRPAVPCALLQRLLGSKKEQARSRLGGLAALRVGHLFRQEAHHGAGGEARKQDFRQAENERHSALYIVRVAHKLEEALLQVAGHQAVRRKPLLRERHGAPEELNAALAAATRKRGICAGCQLQHRGQRRRARGVHACNKNAGGSWRLEEGGSARA